MTAPAWLRHLTHPVASLEHTIRDWWARNVIAPADDPWADVKAIAAERRAELDNDPDAILDALEIDLACDADFRLNIQRVEWAFEIPEQRKPGEIG